MKLKVFSLSAVVLLALSTTGVIFFSVSKESATKVEAYSTSSLTKTIDLNTTADSDIREYYNTLSSLSNSEKTGTNLLKNLKTILKNGQKYYSYDGSDAIWRMYEITDRDWVKSPASSISGYNSTTNIISNYSYKSTNPYVHALYNNREVDNQATAWSSHGERENAWTIEREHIWPKSQGFKDDGSGGARGDPMHLWAAEGSANGSHSSHPYGYVDKTKKYTDVGSTHANATGNLSGISKTKGSGTVFEPQDSDKGDIARAIFYMAARYNYLGGNDTIDTNNPNLELVDAVVEKSSFTSTTSNPGQMGIVSDLLEWNRLDPPDEYEIHRNDLLYTNYTNNRNPFIDFPDWAEYIWGDKSGTSYANPSSDTIHAFSTGGGEPPEPEIVRVTGVSLLASTTIKVDESIVLSPDILPSNATNKAVTWYSDNTDIATVSNGRVTGIAVGTVDISVVTDDGQYEATCSVEVKEAESIDVSSDTLTRSSYEVSGTGYSSWTSDVTGESGAVYAGVTTNNNNAIQLNLKDDSKAGIVVKTSSRNIKRVSVEWYSGNSNGRYLTIYGSNTAYSSTADLYDNAAQCDAIGTITYSDSGTNPLYIDIDSNYKYVGIKASAAVYLSSLSFDWDIPVASVSLDDESIELDLNSEKETVLNATVLPENATNQNLSWSSSNEEVATVNDGAIVAISVGTTTITVTSEDGNKSASCLVNVIDSTPPPTSETTIERSIFEIAIENNWSNGVAFATSENTAVNLDENISFYTTGTGNNGKYYTNGQNWRLYLSGEGNIIIKSEDDYTIKSITLNYSINNGGYLVDDVSSIIESGQAYDVNDESVTYEVAGPANAQVRINNISVTYESKGQTPIVELSSIAVSDYVSSFTTGDTFSFGGTVIATYSDSSTKNVTGSASFSGYDMLNAGTQTVTVSYTENEITKSTTYQITVNDPVPVVTLTDIVVTAIPTKVEFIVGDTFSSAGLEVTATYSNDTTKDVTSSVSLTGYDMSSAGTQTVIISYTEDEITKTTTYQITVKEPTPVITLEKIAITTKPDKLVYEIGDDLDLTGMVVTATYSDKSTSVIADYTVSGYDKNKADTQTIIVTYQGQSDTFTVTVEKTLSFISITGQTTTFENGDTFSFGGTVTAIYSDGSNSDVTSSTTFSGYDMSKAGTQTVTVSYTENGVTKTTTYEIIVNEPTPVVTLTSIAVTTKPNKVEYELGEALESDGLVVTATYSDGSTSVITGYTLSTLDSSKVGEESITVTYEGLTTSFKVLVVNSLVSISISNPTTTFEKGDEFVFGGTVTATYKDGTTEDVTEYASFSGYDMSKVGTQTVTVSYINDIVEKTATYEITINEPAPVVTLTGVTITTNPTKLEYVTGEDLDLTGMVVTATYSDQSTSAVTDYTVSGYDKNKVGTQTITVTYQGYTATFIVTVIDGLKDKKDEAIKSLNEYYNSIDLSKYSLENLMKLLNGLRSGESSIRAAKSVEEINAALTYAKIYLDSIPQEEVPVKPDTPTNTCGGDIFATSAILSIIALMGAALITIKKRK